MRVLDKYTRQLDDILRGLDDAALRIVRQSDETILDLNRGQLLQGLTPQGTKLKPDYRNERYKRAKNRANPLPGFGTPDLKLTGKFHSNFYLTAQNGELEFFSSDTKTSKLIDKYGKDNIFGLTVQNNEVLNYEIIKPKLIAWVLSKIKI